MCQSNNTSYICDSFSMYDYDQGQLWDARSPSIFFCNHDQVLHYVSRQQEKWHATKPFFFQLRPVGCSQLYNEMCKIYHQHSLKTHGLPRKQTGKTMISWHKSSTILLQQKLPGIQMLQLVCGLGHCGHSDPPWLWLPLLHQKIAQMPGIGHKMFHSCQAMNSHKAWI